MLYEIYIIDPAQKQLDKLRKKAKVRWEAIRHRLDELMEDPYADTIELQDPMFMRLWRAKVGNDRIFFQICENCRKDSKIMELRQCVDCDSIPENGIKIFDIPFREKAYDRYRRY